ncbi:zinc finger CCCH domain-containing protein 15 [Cryptomeria japonica]|uniref:zinc finger CCCH domain-containing protein 15 n=1 Tax=Cryptomeria japonica TaxID=3369 RepID=UPI0027DA519F|nr:zinc finger CCCH domain-containing protein 15 [Cryptomeria japonica]
MDAENLSRAQCGAKHHSFRSKSRRSDELWAGSEVVNCTIHAENASSGNVSDDSTTSKECISTRSSWPEDDYTGINTPFRRSFHDNFLQSFSPTHGDNKDQLFESGQQSPETLEYQLVRLTLQYHELSETYNDSITCLRQAEADIDSLIKQNLQLQASNMEIVKLVGMSMPNYPLQNLPIRVDPATYSVIPQPQSLSSMYNDTLLNSTPSKASESFSFVQSHHFPAHHSNGIEESGDAQQAKNRYINITKRNIRSDIVAENSPTSVLGVEFNNKFGHNVKSASVSGNLDRAASDKPLARRPTLPKSISIRSPGFLAAKEGAKKCKPVPVNSPCQPHRLRLAATTLPDIVPVSLPSGENDAEYEAYNQGMWKTELCNKWQDTGACPYADRCQFAHGIEELRPVIRHPRYKTELCRMVAAGDKCPYGHRCHFRHVLTREEKASLK